MPTWKEMPCSGLHFICQLGGIEVEVWKWETQTSFRFDTQPRIATGILQSKWLIQAQAEALRLVRERCEEIIKATQE